MSSAELLNNSIATYPKSTVACFDPTIGDLPRRELNADATIEFLERLATAGAEAVLIAASTGHGHVRTVDELRRWFEIASQANLAGAMRMALLRPEDALGDNQLLVSDLHDLAYDVVFVRPGSNLPQNASDEQIAANMQPLIQLLSEANLPVGVYSIPDVSGVRLSANAAALLLDQPGGDHIVAAKITEADYETSTLEYLRDERLSQLKIVQGWDPHFARALADGRKFDSQSRQRVGVTSGPMSFAVFQYVHMFQVAEAGDTEELKQSQQAVTALFQAMQDDPAKFADLQRAKYIMGLGHPVLGTVTPEQCENVLAALEELPRQADRVRLAKSLNLMKNGPFHERLAASYHS